MMLEMNYFSYSSICFEENTYVLRVTFLQKFHQNQRCTMIRLVFKMSRFSSVKRLAIPDELNSSPSDQRW